MSIASEIERISGNIADAYTALDAKGATLPESQNSANLADTIDSVPTGGGGGESAAYINDFNTMAAILETDVTSGGSETKSQLEEKGYMAVASGHANHTIGFVYGDKVTYTIVNKAVLAGFKIPSSASYEVLDSSRYKVTFTTEKWIIIRATGSSYAQLSSALPYFSKITTETGSDASKLAIPVAVYNYYGVNNSAINNTIGSIVFAICGYIKYLKLKSDITITSPNYSDTDVWNFILGLDNCGDLLKQLSGYDSTNEVYPISGDTAKRLCGLGTSSTAGQFDVLPFVKTGTPVIFDLSSVSGSGTATLFPSAANYCYIMPTVTDLKIKLPSTYTTVDLTYKRYNASLGLSLTKEALQYMATNAPTVTSATVKLGYNNLGYLTYTTEGQEILSTFTGKGWTVAE